MAPRRATRARTSEIERLDDDELVGFAVGGILGEVAAELRREFDAKIAFVEGKLSLLESRQLQYRGTWKPGTYAEGSIISHSGSMWLARSETTARPGAGPSEWLLTVKRGRHQ